MFFFIFYHSFLYDSNTEHAFLSFFSKIVDIQLQFYTDNNIIALDLIDIAQFICQINSISVPDHESYSTLSCHKYNLNYWLNSPWQAMNWIKISYFPTFNGPLFKCPTFPPSILSQFVFSKLTQFLRRLPRIVLHTPSQASLKYSPKC